MDRKVPSRRSVRLRYRGARGFLKGSLDTSANKRYRSGPPRLMRRTGFPITVRLVGLRHLDKIDHQGFRPHGRLLDQQLGDLLVKGFLLVYRALPHPAIRGRIRTDRTMNRAWGLTLSPLPCYRGSSNTPLGLSDGPSPGGGAATMVSAAFGS